MYRAPVVYAAAHAARPPLQTNTHAHRVFCYVPPSFLCVACMCFCVAHGVGVLFALNIYGNAQAGALLILHIARLV